MPKSTFSDAYVTLLAILVRMRKEAGVTQVELSRRLGKPQPFVSNIERGIRRLDLIEFCAVVKALGGDPQAAFNELVRALPRKIEI